MRWGICIVTLSGVPRGTTLPPSWFNTLFGDPQGLAAYYLRMSGGRERISWQVFGPVSLLTPQQKQQLDGVSQKALVEALRQSAAQNGIPVSDFDAFLWVMDEGASTGGVTVDGTTDILIGARGLTPQVTAHEMGHRYGAHVHANRMTQWQGWYQLYGAAFNQDIPLVVISRHPGHMELLTMGTDDMIRGARYENGQWNGWYRIENAAFHQGIRLAAVSRHPNHMELFAIGRDNMIRGIAWEKGAWAPNWYRIENAAFNQDTPLVAVSRHENHMELLAMGQDNMVRGITWENGAWAPNWYRIENAAFSQGIPMAAISRHPERMELIVMGQDNMIRGISWENGGWQTWYRLENAAFYPTAPLALVSRHADHMELLTLGQDHMVRGNRYEDGQWQGWYRIEGAAYHYDTPLVALSRQRDRMELWALGQDNMCRGSSYENGRWQGWYVLDGAAFNQGIHLAAVSRFEDHMELFAIGQDNMLRGNWFAFWEYGDPFCIMGGSGVSRGYVNPALTQPDGHDLTGPGLSAPYLDLIGWLDYGPNVSEIPFDALEQNAGDAVLVLKANQGAPAPGSTQQIALTIGTVPQNADDPRQYWIEYRVPAGFDAGILYPRPGAPADLPPAGVLVLHEIDYTRSAVLLAWTGAVPGKTLDLSRAGYRVRIIDVNPAQQQLSLRLEKLGAGLFDTPAFHNLNPLHNPLAPPLDHGG